MEDWLSNFDIDPIEFRSEDNNCNIHQGYYDAYYNFGYRPQIESFLDKCINECSTTNSNSSDDRCEVVLSGHSQGGAIAEIAGFYLKDRYRLKPNSNICNNIWCTTIT